MQRFTSVLVVAVFAAAGGMAHADQVDIDKIKLPSERSRADIVRDYSRSKQKSSYTLAVGENGSWGSRARTRGMSTNDRMMSALQKCEHFGGAPCGLVIVDGKAVAYKVSAPTVQYVTRYSINAVPFVRAENRGKIGSRYKPNAGAASALALHRNGGFGFENGASSQNAANSKALANCNKATKSNDCFVYDESGKVVFNRSTPLRN